MYNALLIAAISLTGVILASNAADGFGADQNETHLQQPQDLWNDGRIPIERCQSPMTHFVYSPE